MTKREAPATRFGRGFFAPLGSEVTEKSRLRLYSLRPICRYVSIPETKTPPRSDRSRWRQLRLRNGPGGKLRLTTRSARRHGLLGFFRFFVDDAFGDFGQLFVGCAFFIESLLEQVFGFV